MKAVLANNLLKGLNMKTNFLFFYLAVFAIFFISCAHKDKLNDTSSSLGESFKYEVNDKTFQGYIVSGAVSGEKKPAVIIVHEWWGGQRCSKYGFFWFGSGFGGVIPRVFK